MQITIDTNNLSDLDIAMLGFLAGQEVDETPDDTPAPVEPPKATKAPKAEPKPAPAAEPEPADEDLLGGGDPAPTMSDAIAAATELVSSGGAAKVKAALAEVGVKRVSELPEGDITKFLAALAEA